ncbi:hypothetical protein ABIE44_001434 [Marmoricola sp. OAE513]|uniref:hypothetical protein n=1 Tax=Marmoricola sp. OAE513 TaxID=2817894 RepID=UPI001AE81506
MADPRLEDEIAEQVDEATVDAVGKLSAALETIEVARGHLYAFHRLSGTADFELGDAVEALRSAGHDDLADRVERELVGRNVLPGRWTFQVVEEYDEGYYALFRSFEQESRALTQGHQHLYEASLKRERRTPGAAGHEADPSELGERIDQSDRGI